MPSFDIVVQTDLQEVENAAHQARKEIAQRYDFRGSKSRIDFDKGAGEIRIPVRFGLHQSLPWSISI